MALTDVIDTLKQDNSQYTSIGSKQVKPLKQNDSVADILAKIYNFMVKAHEEEVKHYELEKEFREEQKAEDERRHKELLKALTGTTTAPTATPVALLVGLMLESKGAVVSATVVKE